MRYIDSIRGSVIAFICFVVIFFFFPPFPFVEGSELILTVSTFVFAIISGFFLSRLNSRFDEIRANVVEEDALWLSLYETASLLGDSVQRKIAELMDAYYIISYDFDLGKYYKANAKYIDGIYHVLRDLENLDTEQRGGAYEQILSLLGGIEEKRNFASESVRLRLSVGQWGVLVVLAVVVVLSIYANPSTSFYFSFVGVLFSTSIVMVLLIMRDLENFRLGGQAQVVESGQEVFEAMGKMRYYPKSFLESGLMKVPKEVKEYRVGYHRTGAEFDIKIEKRSG